MEARTEHLPLPLFNEIRALHDHIARCYIDGANQEQISEEIKKSQRHNVRIMLDCYKYLNLMIHDSVERFEAETRNIDLTVLHNGVFYPKYKEAKAAAIKLVREAKLLEHKDTYSALETYQVSYNAYLAVEELIENVVDDVHWARVRFTTKRLLSVCLWILSAIASGIISVIIAKYF